MPDVILTGFRETGTNRPLLRGTTGDETGASLLSERETSSVVADIRIDTVGKKVEDVAAEISALVGI